MAQVETPQAATVKTQGTNGKPTALITKEELNGKIQSGEPIQIINVLEPEFYKLGFIKGSKRIPFLEMDSRLGELDKLKEVVTYCASSESSASKYAAKLLADKGFRVAAYEGGIKEWKEAGLQTEIE
jgi:rhodanese-related sulfurtransferase